MTDKKYTTTTCSVAIHVAKSSDEVFNNLIDLTKWWPEEFIGENFKINSEFVLKTGEGHYSKNKVIEFVPNEKVVWLVTESNRKEDNFDWSGTKMIFELMDKGDNTEIKFTYYGVVFENEIEKLAQICDFVIKEKLYNLIESVTVAIEIEKSPREVFKCIKEVPKWWSKDFEGSSRQLNDEFIIHHPNAHYSKQRLIEVITDNKIVWLVTESTLYWLQHDKHEWTNTKMIFDIGTKEDKTFLRFTHEGLVPEKECYARCKESWTMVITDWLYHYILTGITI
jgi:hypothetical protein